jgi:Na+-driven multidrug efflux pump
MFAFRQRIIANFSQFIAQNQENGVSRVILYIFPIVLLLNIIACVLEFTAFGPLLHFLNVSDNLLLLAIKYLIPLLLFEAFAILVYYFVGIIQAQGKSIKSGLILCGCLTFDVGIVASILFFL